MIAPFGEQHRRLTTIPGVGKRTAEVIIAEIGVDMSRFPTAAHLASWAGMCPGNHESGGKRRSGKARKGDAALRSALCESARGPSHAPTCRQGVKIHVPSTGRRWTESSASCSRGWMTLALPASAMQDVVPRGGKGGAGMSSGGRPRPVCSVPGRKVEGTPGAVCGRGRDMRDRVRLGCGLWRRVA